MCCCCAVSSLCLLRGQIHQRQWEKCKDSKTINKYLTVITSLKSLKSLSLKLTDQWRERRAWLRARYSACIRTTSVYIKSLVVIPAPPPLVLVLSPCHSWWMDWRTRRVMDERKDGTLVCVCASGRWGRELLGGNATTITPVCPVRLHDWNLSVCGEEHWAGMLQEVTSPFGLDSLEM